MNYLALGDSYTIGEQVDYENNFPNQVTKFMQQKGHDLKLSQLIAKTGWTTDELNLAISQQQPNYHHDWVTLLIGVNNQYRGRSIEEYSWQFYALLQQSILFANANPNRVIVLSIPDWGMTPFNKERPIDEVTNEINRYNEINQKLAKQSGCHYINITTSTREHAKDPIYLAPDLLHYSDNEYALWAEKVVTIMMNA